jgi:hypothetical protein
MPSLFLTDPPRLDLLWANRHIRYGRYKTWRSGHGAARPFGGFIRASKPASRAFILEIVAALLSVLALRYGMLDGPAVLLEALSVSQSAGHHLSLARAQSAPAFDRI